MTILGVAVLGGTGVKIGNVFLKRLGSPELSLRLVFCALSPGHGPRGKGFHVGSPGTDFCIFAVRNCDEIG